MTKICIASLSVAILNFVVKQVVLVTFLDFLQALTLQFYFEMVKMRWNCITVKITRNNAFSHSVAAILIPGHPYITLPSGSVNEKFGKIFAFGEHLQKRIIFLCTNFLHLQ